MKTTSLTVIYFVGIQGQHFLLHTKEQNNIFFWGGKKQRFCATFPKKCACFNFISNQDFRSKVTKHEAWPIMRFIL